MILLLLILSAIFLAVGFVITEKNAKHLLSGYNTMSEQERKKVDIKGFLLFFRRFHIFLAATVFVIGFLLHNFVDENFAGLFLIFFPLLAYGYLIWKGKKYSSVKAEIDSKIGILMLILSIIFVGIIIIPDFKNNDISFNGHVLEIKARYGENIFINQIEAFRQVNQLPELTLRTNGISMGNIKKGLFKTAEGEKVKLIINDLQKPFFEIVRKDGSRIYFNSKQHDIADIYKRINESIGR
jgi:hypothetical protein